MCNINMIRMKLIRSKSDNSNNLRGTITLGEAPLPIKYIFEYFSIVTIDKTLHIYFTVFINQRFKILFIPFINNI